MLIAGTTVIAGAWWIAQPLRLPAPTYAFDVKSGTTLRAVARELASANVLQNEYGLVLLARLRRADRAIKAGNYEITAMTTSTSISV